MTDNRRERHYTWSDPTAHWSRLSELSGFDYLTAILEGRAPKPPVAIALRLTLAEVPVQVEHSERTTVRALHDGLAMLGNLVRIRQRARRGVYPADAGLPKAGNRA